MKKNILVVTRKFYKRYFSEGMNFNKYWNDPTIVFTYLSGSKWHLLSKIKMRLGISNDKFLAKNQKKEEQKVSLILSKKKYDVIWVCHGTQFSREFVRELSIQYFTVLYLTDEIKIYPIIKEVAPEYDLVLSYSADDVEYLKSNGVNCIHLTPWVNQEYYYPMTIDKDVDISFVGTVHPKKEYGKRAELIDKILSDFPDKKIVVGGRNAPLTWPNRYIWWLVSSKRRKAYVNRVFSDRDCNLLFNRSKINLSLNRDLAGNWISGRHLNILATGSFQLSTSNNVTDKYIGQGLDTFKNYDELRNKISYYLIHAEERERIAKRGLELFENKNVGTDYIDAILGDVFLLSKNKSRNIEQSNKKEETDL